MEYNNIFTHKDCESNNNIDYLYEINTDLKIEKLREKGYKYLAHITSLNNFKIIRKYKYLYTEYERYKNKIDVKGIYSIDKIDLESPYKVSKTKHPGIFMYLIDDIERFKLVENKERILFLFPLNLLLQKNWHFNIIEKNGLITPDTYFSHQINNIPSIKDILKHYDNEYIPNEVVFHDKISLYNLIILIKENHYLKINLKLNLDLESKACLLNYSDYYHKELNFYYHYNKKVLNLDIDDYINNIKDIFPEEIIKKMIKIKSYEKLYNKLLINSTKDIDIFTYFYINR